MVTLVKPVQYENVEASMLLKLPEMATLVKLVHLLNALFPTLVTLSGMVISVKLVHALNAHSPMLVTLPGMVALLILQPVNAQPPILVTPISIRTSLVS